MRPENRSFCADLKVGVITSCARALGHAAKTCAHAAGHAVFKRKLCFRAAFLRILPDGAQKRQGAAGENEALLRGARTHSLPYRREKSRKILRRCFVQSLNRDMFSNRVDRIAVRRLPVPEEQGKVFGGRMLLRVADKGNDAHAASKKQCRHVLYRGKTPAKGTPNKNGFPAAQRSQFLCALPYDLEKTAKVFFIHLADAERTPPGQLKSEGQRPHHEELAGIPVLPGWPGEA